MSIEKVLMIAQGIANNVVLMQRSTVEGVPNGVNDPLQYEVILHNNLVGVDGKPNNIGLRIFHGSREEAEQCFQHTQAIVMVAMGDFMKAVNAKASANKIITSAATTTADKVFKRRIDELQKRRNGK